MPRKNTSFNADDIIQLYNSGESITKIANLFGCSSKPVRRILRENNIPIKNPTAKKVLPVDEIIRLYNSGTSVNALAKQFKVSRTVIMHRLKQANVVIRGQTEANQIMMAARTPEENARNVRAAHDAVRGKRRSHEELCQRALTREQTFNSFVSSYEREIAQELSKRNIEFIPQKAVDKYNIDFAIFDNVAFEIYGGGWHSSGRAAARFTKRSKELFNRGYTIVICWIDSVHKFSPSAIVDYLVALNEILCSDPTSRCKHYVIRGNGQLSTIGCKDLDYVT